MADRLAGADPARLSREVAPGVTAVAAARSVAQRLADTATALEAGAGAATQPRLLPAYPDRSTADVLAVTGSDLLAAAQAALVRGTEEDVVTGAVQAATEALTDLRRLLP